MWLEGGSEVEGWYRMRLRRRDFGFYLEYSEKLSSYTSVSPLSDRLNFSIPLHLLSFFLLIVVLYHCAVSSLQARILQIGRGHICLTRMLQ